MNLHEPASQVKVDHTLADVSADDYDALSIPGGFINPDLLRQAAAARAFVRSFDACGKPIATLCHGPFKPVARLSDKATTLEVALAGCARALQKRGSQPDPKRGGSLTTAISNDLKLRAPVVKASGFSAD